MARYWVGGTGTWDSTSTTNWAASSGGTSGASAPTSTDPVVFDANSGVGTCTSDGTAVCASLDTSLSSLLTFSSNGHFQVAGDVVLKAGMTFSGTGRFDLTGTGTQKFTSVGNTLFGIKIDATSAGTYTLQDSLTINSNNELEILSGSFDANNLDVTAGAVQVITGTATTITMGSGTWTITGQLHTFSHTWFMLNPSLVTIVASTSTIKFTNSSNFNVSFEGGGKVYNNLWFSRGASTGNITVSGTNTFNDFKDSGTTAHILAITASSTQTVTTFTVSGALGNLITLQSTGSGTAFTLSQASGTVNSDYLVISDSTATGGAIWNAGSHSTNGGDNTGWFFSIQVINTFDSINISENINIATSALLASISDNVTINDNIPDIVRGNARDVSVFDSNNVSENTQSQLNLMPSVFDAATIAETITSLNPRANASVFDSINVSENITSVDFPITVSVSDNITVSDTVTTKPTQLASGVDNISVSENITVVRANLPSSPFDSATISESIAVATSIVPIPQNVTDGISISEQVGAHRVRTGWSTNWTPTTNTSTNWAQDSTIPTTKWKKDPN